MALESERFMSSERGHRGGRGAPTDQPLSSRAVVRAHDNLGAYGRALGDDAFNVDHRVEQGGGEAAWRDVVRAERARDADAVRILLD